MVNPQGRRTYVLDTSVLLADPAAITRFDEHGVVLPVVVITELEAKRHHPELGYFARQALRHLDDLRIEHGRLDAELPVGTLGGTVRVELNHSDPTVLPAGFRLGDNDSRILSVACTLAAEGEDVILVSKDLPLRVKAAAVGLAAQEYRAELPVDSGWTGMTELEVGSGDIEELYESGTLDCEAARDIPCHTGLVLTSSNGSALGRVKPDKSVQLVRGDREAFGLRGRSAEQRVALDLLLDPEVGIVSLGGRAGTGKSALALCAGLEAVMERRTAPQGHRVPAALRGRRAGPRLPARLRSRQDGPVGAGRLRHAVGRHHPGRHRRGYGQGHVRGTAPDPHPGPVAARRVRDRGRGQSSSAASC